MPTKTVKLPSQEDLLEFFKYDPNTGDFTRYDGHFGCIRPDGYWYINFDRTQYMGHRLIWKYMTNEEPDNIDHINGDRSDNSWNNLRSVPHLVNCRNHRKSKRNSSGYTGVSLDKNRNVWVSEVWVGRKIMIGSYNCPTKAYIEKLKFLSEFFPNHFHQNHGK